MAQEKAVSEKITIALIEHASRPAAYLVIGCLFVGWLFAVKDPMFQMLGQTQTLKIGSFEVSLRANATMGGVGDTLTALQNLDDAQLQLFLVTGGAKGNISYLAEEVTDQNLKKLQDAGLLTYERIAGGSFNWKVTEKGYRLHGIIFKQVVTSIQRTSTGPSPSPLPGS